MRTKGILLILVAVVILVFAVTIGSVAAAPNGATATDLGNSTAGTDAAGQHTAFAGNVTELDLYADSTTQGWQGYFGNVTGVIELANAAGEVMYNWSTDSPTGQVFAANQSVGSWGNLDCFNYTDVGELNLSVVENDFNFVSDDVDGLDETFYLADHTQFVVGSRTFTSGECNNTKVYNSSGVATFEEVLLYENSTDVIVFTSLILSDAVGFDADIHDFEMMVLEDGHSGDGSMTTYYFYLELDA